MSGGSGGPGGRGQQLGCFREPLCSAFIGLYGRKVCPVQGYSQLPTALRTSMPGFVLPLDELFANDQP